MAACIHGETTEGTEEAEARADVGEAVDGEAAVTTTMLERKTQGHQAVQEEHRERARSESRVVRMAHDTTQRCWSPLAIRQNDHRAPPMLNMIDTLATC